MGVGCSFVISKWLVLVQFHVNEASVGRWKSQVKKYTGESHRRSTGTEIGWNPLQSQWAAILMISEVECKSQLCGALKIYLLLLICLFWKGGWRMHWRHATLYKSANKFQTMVPALAKVVVQFFNKLIGIYSCYCTLLISSLKLLLDTSGWRPQTSAFFWRSHHHRREGGG